MGHRSLGPRDEIVSTFLLIGGDEVRVVDAGERLHSGHLLTDESLKGRLQDLGTVHGISKVHTADVPAANDEIVGVDHGHEVMERDVDLLARAAVHTELGRGSHDDGAVVVGTAFALLGLPNKTAAVGNDTGSNGGTIVATPADQHDTELRDLAVDLEVVEGLLGGGHILAVGVLGNGRGTVSVLGLDGFVSVLDVGRVNDKELLGRGGRRCTTSVRKADAVLGVRSHC